MSEEARLAELSDPPCRDEVAIGAQRVRREIRGEGTPLLLVNGFAGSLEVWENLYPGLGGFRTLAYDAPGTGASPEAAWPLSIPAAARLADRLCEISGFGAVDVIGYSFGGLVAKQLAYAVPDRVRSLVLVSTLPGVGSVPGFGAAIRLLRLLPWATDDGAGDALARAAVEVFGGQTLRARPAKVFRYLPRQPPSVTGWLHQLIAINAYSSLPILPRIRKPTLLLTGDDDPLVPSLNARVMARLIGDATLDVIPDAGHLMLLEDGNAMGERIRRFVRDADDRSRGQG